MGRVRPSRTFENYSRGLLLVRAIREMWELNEKTRWRMVDGRWVAPGTVINARIEAICAEHDLTIPEWHYWCRHAGSA